MIKVPKNWVDKHYCGSCGHSLVIHRQGVCTGKKIVKGKIVHCPCRGKNG